MTPSDADIADLKRLAIEIRGPVGWIGGLSMLAAIMGVVGAATAAFERAWDWALISIAVVPFAAIGVMVTGRIHERRYLTAAAKAGLSPAEAQALRDLADAEDED